MVALQDTPLSSCKLARATPSIRKLAMQRVPKNCFGVLRALILHIHTAVWGGRRIRCWALSIESVCDPIGSGPEICSFSVSHANRVFLGMRWSLDFLQGFLQAASNWVPGVFYAKTENRGIHSRLCRSIGLPTYRKLHCEDDDRVIWTALPQSVEFLNSRSFAS